MEKTVKQIEQAKGNTGLMHQVFEDLELKLETKLKELENEHVKVPELKFLWDQCGNSDYSVAYEACQCVVNLTLKGQLAINESVTALISNVTTARHYSLLTDSITELMLRGQHESARHPFISLYEMQPETWPFIMQQSSSIISNGGINLQALKQIQPFIIYSLCYGSCDVQISLWNLLMGKLSITSSNQLTVVLEWMLESLLWQKKDSDMAHCNFYLTCIQQLSEFAATRKDEELGRVLAIYLASAVQMSHKKYGYGIHNSIRILQELNSAFNLYVEPILILSSQFLLECHANCYEPLLELCQNLIEKSPNAYVFSMVQFAALSILSYSGNMEPSIVRIVEAIPVRKSSGQQSLASNKYFQYLARSPSSSIQVALSVARQAQLMEENPTARSLPSSHPTPDAFFLLKCAAFLLSADSSVLDDIIHHVTSTKRYASAVLTLMLKKLASLCHGRTKLAILYHMPALSLDKMCVPRILQVLEALSGSPQLQPVRIRLLTELWKAEDRVYPFLEKMILSEQSTSDEFLIAKASAIDVVCSLKGEKYGADLLSVISDLLNSSLGKSSPNSGTIASLALCSLVALCRAEVVDLKSVWDLLSPKLNQDQRTSVVIELCNLLALTPQLRIDNEDYDTFTHQAISTLFRISFLTNLGPEVNSTALSSLASFRKQDYHLRCMPDACKDGLKVPAKYLPAEKAEANSIIKAEDVLDFVPGSCWMKLMDCYDASVLQTGLFALLSGLIQQEMESMPLWIYRKAATETTRKNEPANYSGCLKDDSVLAALVQHMQRICDVNDLSRLRMSLSLKLLAAPFERPLPPLDWTVLLPIAQQYDLEAELLEVVFTQVTDSFSAQSIAENVIVAEPMNFPLAMVALVHLGPICKAISLKYVRDFLLRLFTDHQSEIPAILKALRRALVVAEPAIPPEIKQMIGENLLDWLQILPDGPEWLHKVADCFRLLSWTDWPSEPATNIAGKCVTILLLASAESAKSKTGLDYFHKALQYILYIPRVDKEVADLISQCMSAHQCKSSANFLLQFMSHVQLVAMRPCVKEEQRFSNLMDIFCLLVCVMSDVRVFHCCPGNEPWDTFQLGMSYLASQPQWNGSNKKSMLEWIISIADSGRASPDERRHLLKSIPILSGMDKETFLKVLSVPRH